MMQRRARSLSACPAAWMERMESRWMLAVTPVVVDLLALYTPGAAGLHGGDATIESLIRDSVDTMNKALIDSEISLTVRLVHSESIAYSGSGDLSLDRQRLKTLGDGYMEAAPALRDQYGADLVTVIVDGNAGGGNGDLMVDINDPGNANVAYSAIAENSIGAANVTIAHELGHNLGGGHERGNPTQPAVGPFDYSYGYRYQAPNGTWYHDIMSYSYPPDAELPLFANPDISFAGAPVGKPAGDPQSADIASTFQQTAPIVSGYRAAIVPDNAGPAASVFELDRSGPSLDLTIRYRDDSGIDVSTLGSNDITVSGPGGWALPAEFVSMDHPDAAGAFKLATYHITLPATNPDTSSLIFTLNSNAVRDINANAAPAGAIPQANAYFGGSSYAWSQDLGTLQLGSTRTAFGSTGGGDNARFYKLSLASSATVGVALSGMSDNANVLFAQDANNDGIFQNGEELDWSDNSGALDEGVARTLSAGTYYILVYHNFPAPATPWTLSVSAYSDVTPPTATLDATDLRAVGAGEHTFAVTYSDDHEVDGKSVYWDGGIRMDISGPFGNWTWWTYPDPELNSSYANGASRTIYYRLIPFEGAPTFDNTYDGTYTVSIDNNPQRPRDGAGNLIPILTLGSFKFAPGASDTTAPTATLSAAPPVAGQATWDFDVIYRDNTAINAATVGAGDIRVTGPNGFDQLATFVSITAAPSIGSARIATYRVTAPGGFWDGSDDGSYAFALQGGQVQDTAGISATAASLGSRLSGMPNLVNQGGGNVAFNGTGSPDTMRFDVDGSFIYFNLNGQMLWYIPKSSVSRALLNGLGADDQIRFNSGSLIGAVSGGTGNNTLHVLGGNLTLDADAGAGSSILAATVGAGAVLNLASTQHFSNVAITGGTVNLSANGSRALYAGSLSLDSTGRLNLNDNDLIVTYGTAASPFSTIRSLVLQGLSRSVDPSKTGIISSTGQADGDKVLAVVDNALAGLTQFAGDTVAANAILGKYTFFGDMNLDGQVTGDDYPLIDLNLNTTPAPGIAWLKGDANLDGMVTGDDYPLVDLNLGKGVSNPLAPTPAAMSPIVLRPEEDVLGLSASELWL